jgi:hypothetical protein
VRAVILPITGLFYVALGLWAARRPAGHPWSRNRDLAQVANLGRFWVFLGGCLLIVAAVGIAV